MFQGRPRFLPTSDLPILIVVVQVRSTGSIPQFGPQPPIASGHNQFLLGNSTPAISQCAHNHQNMKDNHLKGRRKFVPRRKIAYLAYMSTLTRFLLFWFLKNSHLHTNRTYRLPAGRHSYDLFSFYGAPAEARVADPRCD